MHCFPSDAIEIIEMAITALKAFVSVRSTGVGYCVYHHCSCFGWASPLLCKDSLSQFSPLQNPFSQEQKSNNYFSWPAICRMLEMTITFGFSLCWEPEQLENSKEMVSCGWEALLWMGTLLSSTQTRAKSHLPLLKNKGNWRLFAGLRQVSCSQDGNSGRVTECWSTSPLWESWARADCQTDLWKLWQRVLCALDRKKVPELGWLSDRVTWWLRGACVATQLICRTGNVSSVSRDGLEHKKS